MIKPNVVLAVAAMAILSGCASTKQYVHFPDQSVGLENSKMARIYVARPAFIGCAVSMKIMDNETLIGKTGPKGYLCWERAPGKMKVTGIGEKADSETVNVEKGYVYYFEQEIRPGLFFARNDIDQVSGEEGVRILGKCKPPKIVN